MARINIPENLIYYDEAFNDPPPELQPEMHEWLIENVGEVGYNTWFEVYDDETFAAWEINLEIVDPQKAMLFKLRFL
jgi:hypothetical protein